MSDQSALSKSASSFEDKLDQADKAVAAFEKDDHTFFNVARVFIRANPTVIPLMVLVISILFFGIVAPRFMSPGALSIVMQQVTVTAFVALAQTLIILTAGIDLSVGVILVVSMIVMGRLAVIDDVPVFIAISAGMAVGTLMGLINGILVAKIKLPPFIVTLGTLNVFTALKLWYSHSESVRNIDIEEKAPALLWFGDGFKAMGATIIYGGIALLLLAGALWFVLNHTAWGRHVHAIGDDPEAAAVHHDPDYVPGD